MVRRTLLLPDNFPIIVTLCGSTRFKKEFRYHRLRETMLGKIVLTVALDSDDLEGTFREMSVESTKEELSKLHERKIELSDEILVLDCKLHRCRECDKWIHELPTVRMDLPFGGCVDVPNCPHSDQSLEEKPYIGFSTAHEIDYATRLAKKIRYLSQEQRG